ncbi:Lipoprotein-releasing system ATP-binding protein LolD [Rubripirellula amarantea]|uniref:Lipoprotein-releasing system ATP-binding protein LolD n=2 Tax=Rubripirellula amarantea TaxID=2527999 RepID=A0A5C5WSM7_9BACT|nr:Lipoprotein-releasing system ATP-binding protein LolD [Rubripirellula amarantea]
MSSLVLANDVVKTFELPPDSMSDSSKDANRLTVLDIPHFEIGEAEQVALIGQSGGGKTTLLHLLAGLLKPDSGQIRVAGTELTKLSEQGRDRFRAAVIGYVFQTFNLLPAFTAIENVKLGMTFGQGSPDQKRAYDLLDRVGLADRAGYLPSQMSVGQQQRVAIARSLAGKPKLLLADEPTANVDPASAKTVLDLIRTSCRDENISLLIVTHDMNVANQFDRVEELDSINRALSQV